MCLSHKPLQQKGLCRQNSPKNLAAKNGSICMHRRSIRPSTFALGPCPPPFHTPNSALRISLFPVPCPPSPSSPDNRTLYRPLHEPTRPCPSVPDSLPVRPATCTLAADRKSVV